MDDNKENKLFIQYDDLFDVKRLEKCLKKGSIDFTSYNSNKSNNLIEEILNTPDGKIYYDTWNKFKFQEVFDNKFELFTVWLDIIPNELLSETIKNITKLSKSKIINNELYQYLYDTYIEVDKSIPELLNRIFPVEEEPKANVPTILDIFDIIDENYQNKPYIIISSAEYLILASSNMEKLAELRQCCYLPTGRHIRQLLYSLKAEPKINIYISLIELK